MILESEQDFINLQLIKSLYEHCSQLKSHLQSKKNIEKYQYLLDWIFNKTKFLDDVNVTNFEQRLWHIFNNINEVPKCRICGKILSDRKYFKGKTLGYLKNCDNKHCISESIKITNIEIYGVDNPWKNKNIIQKRQITCKNKYGFSNPSQVPIFKEKSKQTCMDKYGYDHPWKSPEIQEKRKQTYKKLYNCENAGGSKEAQIKIKQTKKEKYGNENYNNMNKNRKTKKERYGDEYYCNTEKAKQTCKDKYGYEYAMQNPEISNKTKTRYKYNGIKFDSAPEIAYYIWLKDNNIEFIYHPNIKQFIYFDLNGKQHFYYPDFYLIKEDQYIEIKGDQFFDKNNNFINPHADIEYNRIVTSAKWKCMLNNNIKILRNTEYIQYIKYVEEKYGRDYLKQFKNN